MPLVTLPPDAVVIDIETKDTLPTACVLSIGYAVVDIRALRIVKTGQVFIDQNSQVGRSTSDDTMKFWAAHPEAWARQLAADRVSPASAFEKLRLLVPSHPVALYQPTWWGYGPSFDLVVLESLARDCGVKAPWIYRQHRDLRTLFELTDVKPATFRHGLDALEYDAKDDAETEALAMLAALRSLGYEPEAETFAAASAYVEQPAVTVGA